MSEEEKKRPERSAKAPGGETPEDKAAGSPGPGPMGTGDPEAGGSGPMGTESAQPNSDAASRDKKDEGDD